MQMAEGLDKPDTVKGAGPGSWEVNPAAYPAHAIPTRPTSTSLTTCKSLQQLGRYQQSILTWVRAQADSSQGSSAAHAAYAVLMNQDSLQFSRAA